MKLINSDCLKEMKTLEDNSVDSIVTDPPYGLKFMGKKWDYDVPSKEIWIEALRVLKPGGHLLSFGGSRTYHRMAVAIEDAGFEIRDQIMWVYGSGFPKSHNISKAINKIDGVEFEEKPASGVGFMNENDDGYNTTKNQLIQKGNSSERASKWEGWGTATKPAHEPICMARKPLEEKTVANNVLEWGTGGINIDESRVGTGGGTAKGTFPNGDSNGIYGNGLNGSCEIKDIGMGRFPANFIHDGSDEVVGLFPDTGKSTGGNIGVKGNDVYGKYGESVKGNPGFGDSGSAARFFYCAKASKRERGEGNNHATVKPLKLMEYLIRLITPPQGTVLDPFMGSGTTGIAAKNLGFNFIGIELDQEYFEIAKNRI
jgi:DNA modification methylase